MASKANINIDQGSTFNTVVSLTDDYGNALDLSAYSGKAQIRTSYASVNSISFGVALANGQVTLSLDSNTTSSMTRSRYVYDLLLTDGSNNVTRVLEGVIYVDPTVTRAPISNAYYTMYVANTQSVFYAGDIVYQSNGTANVTGVVYWSETPLGFGSVGSPVQPGNRMIDANVVSIIKVTTSTNNVFVPTGITSYKIYDANTSANGIIMSVTQTTGE
jgi:hypothetical protein